jgi:hypothetical protein
MLAVVRYALVACLLLALGLAASCAGGFSTFLSGRTPVTVRMEGGGDIAPPIPVLMKGTRIGDVVGVRTDDRGKTSLSLAVDKEFRDSLKQSAVFFRRQDEAGDSLVYEVLDLSSPRKEGDLVYVGFPSYEQFLAWRARNLASEKLGEFLDILGGILKGQP